MLKIKPRGKKAILQIIGKVRGRRVHQSTGTTSWPHAEALRIKLEKQILDEEVYGKPATATFAEAVEAYLDQGGSPRFAGPITEHFGRWLLGDITQAEVQKFARKHWPRATPQTLNRQVFTPLIAIWNAAHEAKLCGQHEFRRPRQPEREPVAFARDDTLAALLPACGGRLQAAILFVSFTGARASECCRLEDQDVDWEVRSALLRRTKSGQPRTVVLPPSVHKAMLPFRGVVGPLFGFKTRWTLNQALARACRRAGLPVMTSHKVGRHAFAARLLKKGRTLKEVQEAGGWSAESMALVARIYGHLERSAVDKLVREADAELQQIVRKSARSRLQVIDGKRKRTA